MKYNNENRQLKAAQTKTKIYESGEYLFETMGYQAVSVDAIVTHAKVAKGSFYQHFESKGSLLAQIIIQKTANVDLKYAACLQSLPAEASCKDKLLVLTDTISDVLVNDIGIPKIRSLYQTQLTEPVLADTVSGYKRTLYKLITDVLEEGCRKGEFREGRTSAVLAKYLMTAYRGITYACCLRYPDFEYKEQMRAFIQLLIEGL